MESTATSSSHHRKSPYTVVPAHRNFPSKYCLAQTHPILPSLSLNSPKDGTRPGSAKKYLEFRRRASLWLLVSSSPLFSLSIFITTNLKISESNFAPTRQPFTI